MSAWLDVGKGDAVYLAEEKPRFGGIGIVRKGYWDGDESHPVAVKYLAPIEGRGHSVAERKWLYENSVRRFEWERKILAKLNRLYKKSPLSLFNAGHWLCPQPFPRYYGHGVDRRLGRFFVMEWCEPLDVHELKPKLDLDLYACGICDAIGWLHRQGFVHCDLKPGNVMRRVLLPAQGKLLNSWDVMLVDFGSVHKIEEPLKEGERLRASPGTLSVMEDGRRYYPHTPGFADPLAERHTVHADIYSIGQTLREMFADEIPVEWSRLINRCTCRRHDRRFQSVEEIAYEIEHLAERRHEIFGEFLDEQRLQEIGRQEAEYEGLDHGPLDVTWDDVLEKAPAGGARQPVYWSIRESPIRSNRIRVKGNLVLPKNVILVVEGDIFVIASVRGKAGSAVIVKDGATFHNCAVADADGAQEVYALFSGAYLNFPKITESEWARRKKVEERVFKSLLRVTHLAFHGVPTQYGIRKRMVARVRATCLPDSFRDELARWFETAGVVESKSR